MPGKTAPLGSANTATAHDMLWTYGILTAQAIAPIILGSFKSLKTPLSVRTAQRKARRADRARSRVLLEDVPDDEFDELEGDEEDGELDETLTWSDTLIFPVLGSVVLLGFYFALKYLGSEWINFLIGIYFSGAGVFAFHSTFGTLISFILRTIGHVPKVYHIRVSSNLRQVAHNTFTLPSLLLVPFSLALPIAYIPLGRPYILSNIIALSLSTATLQLLRLDSFFTAGLLLGVLLVYDIFWVFATPVMVTVAKGLDAPIKLLAPKPNTTGGITDFAMLGLGDVVIPGLMIALCLRFDLAQHALRNPGKTDPSQVGPRASFARPYFWTGIISYLVGLGVTIGVMQHFKRAQPALLYLSPACFLGPLLLAVLRGELKELWKYTELAEDDKDKKDKAKLLDDTIEPGSEVAQRARAEKAGQAGEGGSSEDGNGDAVPGGAGADDDSWMEGGVAAAEGAAGGARKRKGKKK